MKAIFGGKDPSSDHGNFRIVVECSSLIHGLQLCEEHLRSLGRSELISATHYIGLYEEPTGAIIHSNVEKDV